MVNFYTGLEIYVWDQLGWGFFGGAVTVTVKVTVTVTVALYIRYI